MSEHSQSLDEKVGKWLLETGYPLEMRTVQAFSEFESAPFAQLYPNTYYADSKLDQGREVDLILAWVRPYDDAIFLVSLVIECKSTSEPWVIFKRDSKESFLQSLFDPSHSHILRSTPEAEGSAFFARLELEGLLVDNLPDGMSVPMDGYAIVTAFKSRNARDPADHATRQVLSAANHAGFPSESDFNSRTWYCYSVPVIVTTSPLYEAYLGDDGYEVAYRRVSVSSVNQNIPDDPNLDSATVTIFHESAMGELLSHCRHMQRMFMALNATSGQSDVADNDGEDECMPEDIDEDGGR